MVWEFECPVEDCEFTQRGNAQDAVVESAQQHTRDAHGELPTRDEVEPHVFGPG